MSVETLTRRKDGDRQKKDGVNLGLASELLKGDRCEFLHCETKSKTDRPYEVP